MTLFFVVTDENSITRNTTTDTIADTVAVSVTAHSQEEQSQTAKSQIPLTTPPSLTVTTPPSLTVTTPQESEEEWEEEEAFWYIKSVETREMLTFYTFFMCH